MVFRDRSILSVKKVLSLPWQSQLDSATDQWQRMCQCSSGSMLCEYYVPGCLSRHPLRRNGEQLDDFYLRILHEKFGDTTDVQAHLKMHRWLGVNTRFSTQGMRETLEWHLSRGHLVLCGQLHHGSSVQPDPNRSHWNACVGWDPVNDCFVFHDPAGSMRVEGGGYASNDGRYRKYPWQHWQRRWMADIRGRFQPGAGWHVVAVTDRASGKYLPL